LAYVTVWTAVLTASRPDGVYGVETTKPAGLAGANGPCAPADDP
jgi:hypothetical protein